MVAWLRPGCVPVVALSWHASWWEVSTIVVALPWSDKVVLRKCCNQIVASHTNVVGLWRDMLQYSRGVVVVV